MVQQIGIGIFSKLSRSEPLVTGAAAIGAVVATRTGGAVRTRGSGAVMSGCVFAIFTVAVGGAAGSGKMLIRAVSFFGAV
jgi:hypothetical protein